MEILGIGPLELLFILLIALIVLGPGDMVKAGRTLGRFMRKVVMSPEWRTIQKASREMRYLPNRLMREANMDDLSKDLADINKIGGQISEDVKKMELDISSWTTPPDQVSDHSILPAVDDPSTPPGDTTKAPDPPKDTN
jgi:Sec-independent protein translocase protein TatA